MVAESRPTLHDWVEGLRYEQRLLWRCRWLLEGLAGSPIPSKLWEEYQALSAELAEYLAPDEEDYEDEEEEGTGG